MDLTGVKSATDELTTRTVPELVAALNTITERLEKMVARLDGATITFHLGEPK